MTDPNDKVIVLTRKSPTGDTLWVQTWEAKDLDAAKEIAGECKMEAPEGGWRLRWMPREKAELMEERVRDWESDIDWWS